MLKVNLLIDAALKQLSLRGLTYYIVQRGDVDTGVILLKLSDMRGQCRLLSQMRNFDGALEWYDVLGQAAVSETEADGYIQKSKDNDPDLWIIEIEDPAMSNPFDS